MRPFSDGDTFATFRNMIDKVVSEINALDNEYVLKASQAELEQYFIDKVVIAPLILHVDQLYIENQTGTSVDVTHDFNRFVFPGERAVVRGTRLDIAIPYEGDAILWRIRPSTFSLSGYPDIDVRNGVVVLSLTYPDDSANSERLRAEIDQQTKSLQNSVGNLHRDVENHNQSALSAVKAALQRKRDLALASTGAIAALGIPMKRRDSLPTFTIPTTRRQNPAKLPTVSPGKYQPEPTLDEKEYQYILEVIRSMSLVIERNPSSFATMDEEAIRDHFLLQLNGHYEGGATGETFNASGKTDILIRANNKNVFIAECKFWRGPKAFDEAVTQLLGYLSWRDSKCALLIFNKTRDTTAVRQKMHEVMVARPEYKKTLSHNPDGDGKYMFVKESDSGREIIITTQLYDVPTHNV